MPSKSRKFAITDFVYDIDAYSKASHKYSYIIVGKEVCPETGRKHLQVFLYCKSPRSFNSLEKEWKPRHIEMCNGSIQSNIDYCSKEGDFIEFGERPKGQGSRTDIEIVREVLDEEPTMRAVTAHATSFQSVRLAECFLSYHERKRNWKPEVTWIYGPTGTGKTRLALSMCGDDFWISGKNLRWWQGYDGHKDVIIDDFRKDFCTFHELLRILDRYPYTVEVKGGSRQLLAQKLIITCPEHPRDIFNTREDVGQLLRRIDDIVHLGNGTEVNGTEVGGNTKAPPSFDLEEFLTN